MLLKLGFKSQEEYEDLINLKTKQIENNEIFLMETIKKYEEKLDNLKVHNKKIINYFKKRMSLNLKRARSPNYKN